MESLRIDHEIISTNKYQGNKNIESLALPNAMFITSNCVSSKCEKLKNVYFGLDITRIGNRTFAECPSLTDVYFGITDKDKIIEIAEDAFADNNQDITFHIFASALDNKYLNNYARKHHFKVVGMI